MIGPQAGSYWKHLDEKLATEAAPNHAFHVLGVYPWTRLLVTGRPEPVQVIDSCCIRPGRVIAVEEDGRLEVFAEQLVFRHGKLGLEPTIYTGIESLFVSGFAENDAVALHWGAVCNALDEPEATTLADQLGEQVEKVNRRLASGS